MAQSQPMIPRSEFFNIAADHTNTFAESNPM